MQRQMDFAESAMLSEANQIALAVICQRIFRYFCFGIGKLRGFPTVQKR